MPLIHLPVEERPRLIAFDLDDTLAPSKSPLPEQMAHTLARLTSFVEVCVISGGLFAQFQTQVIDRLPEGTPLGRFHMMPTCGTHYVVNTNGEWTTVYREELTPAQRRHVMDVLTEQAQRLGLWEEHTWGPILEDRGTQVTFSALGQEAPVDAKKAWDPDGSKKEMLRAAVAELVPDLEVRSGGSTSVDITAKGIDKGYGIERLAQATGYSIADMIFIGDRLDEGGNDFPVLRTGIRALAVSGWEETVDVLTTMMEGWQQ